jgi:hypothetical protein
MENPVGKLVIGERYLQKDLQAKYLTAKKKAISFYIL